MGAYGMSVLLVNQSNVHRVLEEVRSGWQRPVVYLDLSSRPGDVFEELLYACAKAGTHTIRKPQDTKWVLKAQSHPELQRAGLPVPQTVIFKADEPDRELTDDERARVGQKVVIKPSFGEASKGCVVGVPSTKQNIAQARDYNRDFDWLVQRMVSWTTFGHRQAYVRGYNVCGHRTLLWWCKDKGRDGYDVLTWDDLQRYDLLPALKIVDRLAELTGMDFFSTEIAITAESGPDRFCLIDYVNDQCDMDPQAHPEYSPSPAFGRWVAERIAEFAWRRKCGLETPRFRGVFLPDTGEK
jgi:hypothetical protein